MRNIRKLSLISLLLFAIAIPPAIASVNDASTNPQSIERSVAGEGQLLISKRPTLRQRIFGRFQRRKKTQVKKQRSQRRVFFQRRTNKPQAKKRPAFFQRFQRRKRG